MSCPRTESQQQNQEDCGVIGSHNKAGKHTVPSLLLHTHGPRLFYRIHHTHPTKVSLCFSSPPHALPLPNVSQVTPDPGGTTPQDTSFHPAFCIYHILSCIIVLCGPVFSFSLDYRHFGKTQLCHICVSPDTLSPRRDSRKG